MRKVGISLLVWIVTIAVALIGAGVQYKAASESETWPTASGVIETAQVEKFGARYWPRFGYAYQVEGVERKGRYIRYHDLLSGSSSHGSTDSQWAKDYLDGFYPGQQVTVHYNPANAMQSWLVASPLTIWQCMPLWGFFLQFAGACFVMQRLALTRKAWLFIPSLVGVFSLWVWFFIAMRPPG